MPADMMPQTSTAQSLAERLAANRAKVCGHRHSCSGRHKQCGVCPRYEPEHVDFKIYQFGHGVTFH